MATKAPRYRTTRDIVIPAGTEVGPAPKRIRRGVPFSSILIGFDKDTTGDLSFVTDEAIKLGLIEVVE